MKWMRLTRGSSGATEDSEADGVQAEVDRIKGYYAVRVEPQRSRAVDDYVLEERRHLLRSLLIKLARRPMADLRLCDVGCGEGSDLAFWAAQGVPQSHLAGTELQPHLLREARSRLSGADLREVDGFMIPFPDASFDVVLASLVFSSILDGRARARLFAEMRRVAAPGGIVALYDFRIRKPSNPNVVAMTRIRIAELGVKPALTVGLTPLLPVLPLVLRLPGPLKSVALRGLPRTHAISIWRR